MRIGGIGGTAIDPPRQRSGERHPPAQTEARAVVAVQAPAAGDRPQATVRHPSAPFLAQLIATQMRLPQTRTRRRAEPEVATEAYGAQATAAALGCSFRRSA